MAKEYEIEVSNGMKVSVELESATGALMLHITFPTSGKRVTFTRRLTGDRPRGSVDSGGLRKKREDDRPRVGSTHDRKMQSITDTGGSGLMLTFGDPEDPNMP